MFKLLFFAIFIVYLGIGCRKNISKAELVNRNVVNSIKLKLDSIEFKIGEIDTSIKLLVPDKLSYDQVTVFSDSCYNSQHYNYHFGEDSTCENYSFNYIGDSLAEIQITILISSITQHSYILNDSIDLLKNKNHLKINLGKVNIRDTIINNLDYRIYNIKAKQFAMYSCWSDNLCY